METRPTTGLVLGGENITPVGVIRCIQGLYDD